MRARALALLLLSVAGTPACAVSPRPHWRAGIAPVALAARRPARRPEDVAVFFKGDFGVFERTFAKRGFACDSVTLLRRSILVPGASAAPPPDRSRVRLAELTTEEFPRDEERSRISGDSFTRVLGTGDDERTLFTVVPSDVAIARGTARLKELAAELGADAVEDVFATVYAEHQMWAGTKVSFDPVSTESPIYADIRLLDFKLRDVRLHGMAVIYED